MYLKKLKLVNYCGFAQHELDFTKPNGQPFNFICFFGPNGIGKSTLLNAIELLTMNTTGQTADRIKEKLAKFVRNEDYMGAYQRVGGMGYKDGFIVKRIEDKTQQMLIEGTFSDGKAEYIVQLTEFGFIRNDLCPIPPEGASDSYADHMKCSGPFGKNHLTFRQRLIHGMKSDSDLSMSKFQLKTAQIKAFQNIVHDITGFKTECINPSGVVEEDLEYCTDYVLIKGKHRIHFKSMSAGEKKITKSFSILLNLIDDLEHPRRQDQGEIALPGFPRIVLMDNVVMHVYYKRHVSMVDRIKQTFGNRQIFATTHSGTLIQRYLDGQNDQKNELWIDLEPINGIY